MILVPDFALAPELVAILACAAFFAGCVDAIAGGGGLITVPAMLLAGLPPVTALATNKLQGTFGVLSATLTFWRAGRIERAIALPLALSAFAGGVTGAAFARLAPDAVLRLIIPFLLVGIAGFMLFSPQLGQAEKKPRLTLPAFALSAGLGLGLYDGLFGPGTGTFYLIALILLLGFGVMRASAHTKLMNFASNLGALLFFAGTGTINVPLGLVMGAMAAAGAYCGTRLSLTFGPRLVRPLVVVISILMALRLMLDAAHPLGAWIRG